MENINNDTISLEERYKLIIAARNFHYDNFSKWMTYFYVAVGALFVGYCTIITNITNSCENRNILILKCLLPVIGYFMSILWYWSAKGYYYWCINFIMLINHYEKDLLKLSDENRVYFVFANKDLNKNYYDPRTGANISTSKIAVFFAFMITIFWGIITIYQIINLLDWNKCPFVDFGISLIIAVGLTLLLSYLSKFIFSSYTDDMPDLKLDFKNNKVQSEK